MINLATKLVAVMEAVTHLEKNGRNEHHQYDYVKASDAMATLRAEFVKHKIAVLPSVARVEHVDIGAKGAKLTTATGSVQLVDGDSGETLTLGFAGTGADNQDKGLYKAITGGIKYFLLAAFLIPTGDDPEASDDSGKSTAHAPARPAPAPIAAPQRRAAAAPAARPAAPAADHSGEGGAVCRISDVSYESKENRKKGTTFNVYTIVTDQGEALETVIQDHYKIAKTAHESGGSVRIVCHADKWGNKLDSIVLLSGATASGPDLTDDDIPF